MDKKYLIMLPGWGMKSFVWNKISKQLSEDFELIYVEWEDIHSLDEFNERVVQTIKQKQISSFSLLGWSLGALAAIETASNNIWDIEHLILIGATSSFVERRESGYKTGWNKRVVERMKSRLNKTPKETLENFYEAMFTEEEKKRGYHKEFLQMAEHQTETSSLALGLDYLIQKDVRAKLSDIDTPLLLIHGEEDCICPRESAEYIKGAAKSAVMEVVGKGGHIPFFTNPDGCYNAITKFTRKISEDEKDDR